MLYAIAFFGVMSLIALVLYGLDKAKAKRGAWRIPERALLAVSLFGGATGALIAMNLFRHKTKHWYFWAVGIIGLILHIFALVLIYLY